MAYTEELYFFREFVILNIEHEILIFPITAIFIPPENLNGLALVVGLPTNQYDLPIQEYLNRIHSILEFTHLFPLLGPKTVIAQVLLINDIEYLFIHAESIMAGRIILDINQVGDLLINPTVDVLVVQLLHLRGRLFELLNQ